MLSHEDQIMAGLAMANMMERREAPVEAGAPASICEHGLLYKGTHPSFKKGCWLCADCEQFVVLDLGRYGVILAAFLLPGEGGPHSAGGSQGNASIAARKEA